MQVYEARDVEEAVELAYTMKSDGRCNWFRGQVQDWAPHSSLLRVRRSGDVEKERKTTRRAGMFFDWVGNISELSYLQRSEHVHDLFAIMQHYGIPTNYIDFTTDPGTAGFFAADTARPPTEEKSCIYCLDTDDLMETWDALKTLESRKAASVELVTLDVRNLWRLQAQQGVFLFADYNLEVDYPMDRILFPYSGYPSYPTHDRIYPPDKSPLEQLLDQYFYLESATFYNEETRRWIEEEKARGRNNIGYVEWETWPEGFYAGAFTIDRADMMPLQSWSPEMLRPWEVASEEVYCETVGPTLTLKLNTHAGSEEVSKSVNFGVNQILRSDSTIRSKAVNWSFSELPESVTQDDVNATLRPVWNGMRRLPYEDREIATALGTVMALLTVGFGREVEAGRQEQRFSQLLGDCMPVGFAYQDGSGSQAFATRKSLQRALRPDMIELLESDFKESANDVHQLFGIIYNPKMMFDFGEFKAMFAREVIPAQAALRRSLILFNPARLKTFGLP